MLDLILSTAAWDEQARRFAMCGSVRQVQVLVEEQGEIEIARRLSVAGQQRCLEPQLWELLLATYAAPGYVDTWEALFAMCRLFRRVAVGGANRFGFDYPHGEDERVSAYLQRVRSLPRDA